MARERILIVEDEEEILDLIAYNLAKAGYEAIRARSGEEALRQVAAAPPDLVLLDLMLPGIDGLEVCRRLKRRPDGQTLAIVMLTAKGEEADVVAGLEVGADDYITKPFSPKVLVARVRAVLRRRSVPPVDDALPLRVGELLIHPGRHEVRVGETPVTLTATEFRVLQVLARRPGWVCTRQQIATVVHGGDDIVTDRSVDVQIVSLRRKLGAAGDAIETIRGVGYRFKE